MSYKSPPPLFNCVKDACKIALNGHLRVGFDYSKGVSRSFLYELKEYRYVLFCWSHDPPRTPQTLSAGSLFLSLPRDCGGPQRPAQMLVISTSILTDSHDELGPEFVATLCYTIISSGFFLFFSCFPMNRHYATQSRERSRSRYRDA